MCLLSLTLFESGELMAKPGVYIICRNGDYLDLPMVKRAHLMYLFEPPLCFEKDISDRDKVLCHIKDDDFFYDEEIGFFTVDGRQFVKEQVVTYQKATFTIQLIRKEEHIS